MLTITYLLAQAAFRSREPVGHQCQVWGWGRCPGGLGDALWGAGGSAVGRGGSCREPAGSVVSAPCVSPCRALPSVPAQEFENAEGDDYVTEFSAQGFFGLHPATIDAKGHDMPTLSLSMLSDTACLTVNWFGVSDSTSDLQISAPKQEGLQAPTDKPGCAMFGAVR